MKKILLLFLLLISNFAFSQSYLRAHSYTLGYADKKTDEIIWNGKPTECNILIRIDGNDVVIYSREIQNYHLISKIDSKENTLLYRMVDGKGIVCNLYIGKFNDGGMFVSVEYSDISLLYFVEPEK